MGVPGAGRHCLGIGVSFASVWRNSSCCFSELPFFPPSFYWNESVDLATSLFETLSEGMVKQELHVEEFLYNIILNKGQIGLLD